MTAITCSDTVRLRAGTSSSRIALTRRVHEHAYSQYAAAHTSYLSAGTRCFHGQSLVYLHLKPAHADSAASYAQRNHRQGPHSRAETVTTGVADQTEGYRRAHGYRAASQDSAATSKLGGPSGTGMQRLTAALRFVLTQLETSVSAGTDSETPNVAAPSQLDGHTNPMSPPRRSSDGVARYAVEDCTVSPALPYTPATREPDVHASMTARTEVFEHRFLLTRERAAASPPSRTRV
ncbi:hypothetical protein OH76DRAFT_538393 [Lentinus brumalis]|uniref:Uncharacterized protein n=1 Tax=Lentinus brumalis TaxID=2498619 RepID=A0A371CHL5_9APHY|nr:hypothetical protein OH76DRAFT_538393 [Polyporus brumalis]